ncbi:hypothetical protein AAX29_00580 [Aliarcobacter thereius]|uniref:Uncharacterized protein n=1 Tax=Aliarcobacter thereius TaxID=544718 RepID=A0A1C0B7G1_9BACT|nr:hypothetical protein [Aliarcobacter thereius]OCL99539.1 hypothetical protein AAX29_00580 [Aliarcobacter thereius]
MKIETNKNDIKKMIDKFSDIEKKQVPFATMITLNKLAFSVMQEQKKETLSDLAWKRKNIPSTIRYIKATKSNQVAELFLNKKSWIYYALKQHFLGGERHSKGLENYLKSKYLLEKNEYLIPVNGLKKTASKIAMEELKKNNTNFYVISSRISYQKAGIYQRNNAKFNRTVMLFKIVKSSEYKKRFDLEDTVIKVHKQYGKQFFVEALENAIKTAK